MAESKCGRNPVLPINIHIPDGEAHVMPDGRLYVYGSLDRVEGRYCSESYVVASTADMYAWEISNSSFHSEQVPWYGSMASAGDDPVFPKDSPTLKSIIKLEVSIALQHPIRCVSSIRRNLKEKKKLLYAPDAIYYNGQYYLYFCMSDNSEGVAVSSSPNGPFLNPTRIDCKGIDPAVFIDSDGQGYYYWGQFTGKGAKLTRDMLQIDKDTTVDLLTEKEHFFHEGSSVRKHNGTYYYVFADSSRGRPTALGYATATSPLGPYQYRGIIIDNIECDHFSWNNHGSIEEFNGQWYVFYHRSSRGDKFMRRLCVEPIFFNADGTINEVKMTSQGAGVPYALGENILAYEACGIIGHLMIAPYKESEAIVGIRNKDSAIFRYFSSDKPITQLSVIAEGSGKIEFLLNGNVCGYANIKNGIVINSDISAPAGIYEIICRFRKVKNLKLLSFSFQ
jgi:hypothetical protein